MYNVQCTLYFFITFKKMLTRLFYFTFSVVTKHRGYLMQTLLDKEVYEWLYAINPLLAGQIRYVISRYC